MSMYAIVAPGISGTYSNWKEVERIKALYPYPKWAKFNTEAEANEWLARNKYGHGLYTVDSYGDIIPNLHIKSKYIIFPDCLCIQYDMSRVGNIKLYADDCIVEYKGDIIKVTVPNIQLSNEAIDSHMVAVYNTIALLGPILDVDVFLPYYSVFYALTSYSGVKQRAIQSVKNLIQQRTGNVAFSMKFKEAF